MALINKKPGLFSKKNYLSKDFKGVGNFQQGVGWLENQFKLTPTNYILVNIFNFVKF